MKPSRAHLRVLHKAAECIGCAACEENAPDYFHLDDDGMAQLAESTTQGPFQVAQALRLDEDSLRAAAADCPVDIIRVET